MNVCVYVILHVRSGGGESVARKVTDIRTKKKKSITNLISYLQVSVFTDGVSRVF
jgi:hypothetical protein